jgi:hypothetical protein
MIDDKHSTNMQRSKNIPEFPNIRQVKLKNFVVEKGGILLALNQEEQAVRGMYDYSKQEL